MGPIFRPPPRLRTEMLLSVRSPTLSVPTWVGSRWISGGSLRVYLGSQRVARAVVSWLATVKGEDCLLVVLEAGVRLEEVEEAVVESGKWGG